MDNIQKFLLIPENFKGSLPSIDEIESELRKDTEG